MIYTKMYLIIRDVRGIYGLNIRDKRSGVDQNRLFMFMLLFSFAFNMHSL